MSYSTIFAFVVIVLVFLFMPEIVSVIARLVRRARGERVFPHVLRSPRVRVRGAGSCPKPRPLPSSRDDWIVRGIEAGWAAQGSTTKWQ